jgi:hypothetical protein
MYGNKVIAVRFGTIDMHGAVAEPTWTRLAATANVGALQLELADQIVSGWRVGDKLFVASSEVDMNEAEELILTSISSDNRTIGVTTLNGGGLQFRHYGELETHGGQVFDMRAEVGLLSRRVLVRGDETTADTLVGAHIMMHSGGDESVVGRFSNVECYLCGQAFALGRYPIHFHMIGRVIKSYITNCAVHHSNNRGFTIHGVHGLRLYNNVVFNNLGHSIFIEDGIETNNVIEHNLVAMTRQSLALLHTDVTPASFWITNPNNQWINNHAAGSHKYGN